LLARRKSSPHGHPVVAQVVERTVFSCVLLAGGAVAAVLVATPSIPVVLAEVVLVALLMYVLERAEMRHMLAQACVTSVSSDLEPLRRTVARAAVLVMIGTGLALLVTYIGLGGTEYIAGALLGGGVGLALVVMFLRSWESHNGYRVYRVATLVANWRWHRPFLSPACGPQEQVRSRPIRR
jgi:hypothetical protein